MNSVALIADVVSLGRAAIEPPRLWLPVGAVPAVLGFPSPAEDFQEDSLDLNDLLVHNPPATFFYRARGWSMAGAGILDGDVLIVDRSLRPRDGDIVVAVWEGNTPVCKVLRLLGDHVALESRNDSFAPIALSAETQLEAFCVVGVVRSVRGAG